LEEEMRECTPKDTGIGGQTSKERFTEITLGRTHDQQGLAATCKDRLLNLAVRRSEVMSLAHKLVVAINIG